MICGAVAAYGMPAAEAADDTICISTSQTVHIRFASELKYVNLSDKAIVARIVDNSKDILAVKAVLLLRRPVPFPVLRPMGRCTLL